MSSPSPKPTWLPIDERRAVRRPLQLAATVRGPNLAPDLALVTDLSARGCRIASERRVSVGSFLTLAIPGSVDVDGWVAWRMPHGFGLDFSRELPAAVIEHLFQRATEDGHTPSCV